MQTKRKFYIEFDSANTILKNLLKTTIRKRNGKPTTTSLSHKMICIQLHGKRNLEDTYSIFLSYILIPTQSNSTIVTHRDQIQLLSRVPIFTIQATVKRGKFDPFLTHQYHNFQRLHRRVKIRTMRPPSIELKMTTPNIYMTQLSTPLQCLRLIILLLKIFRQPNLAILEEANTTYALTLILITQKYTDTDMCKKSIWPLFVRQIQYSTLPFHFSHTSAIFFLFLGQIRT